MKYILLPIPTARFHTLQRLLRYFSIQRYVKIYKIRPLKRIKWRQFSSDRDFIRRRDGCRQRGIDRFSLLPRCLLRSGSQGPGRVARAANIESRSTSPPVPFSSDSRCLPAAKFIPLNGTCQQTGSSREKASSESVFENSSRQTRVKKKEKKGFSPLSVIGLWPIRGMEDFPRPSAVDSPRRGSFSSMGWFC